MYTEEDNQEQSVYEQAWFTLVQLKTLLRLDEQAGYLRPELADQLRRATGSLETVFPRPEEENDIPF